jgi:predicted GNAT superfamily acetyltransferase
MAASQAAGKTVSADKVAIRNCSTIEDFQNCVNLQREVWGFSDLDLVPVRVFSVASKIGGQVIGAWEGGSMVGFSLSFPATHRRYPYLHSHMLAVKKPYRNTGLGRRIKLFQREDAIERGYDLIEWTFDPLEIKNAYFNLQRLGAIARRYHLNQYGITTSPLQGFLPTDRLVAEWWITSKRVKRALADGDRPGFEAAMQISVPAEIYAWKANHATRPKAAAVQSKNREQFLTAFAEGLACLGYGRGDDGSGVFLLGKWDEDWSYATKT